MANARTIVVVDDDVVDVDASLEAEPVDVVVESADVVLVSDVAAVGIGTVGSPFELSPLEQAPSTSAATTMNEKAGRDRIMTTPLGDAQVRSRRSAGGDRSRSRSQRPHPIRVGETECERCQDRW